MIDRLVNWLIQGRFAWVIAFLIIIPLAVSGAQYLRFNAEYKVFFDDDNPQLRAFEELQQTYTKNDNVMFVIAPKDGNVFTPQTLESIMWLTERAWKTPFSIRVDSVTNFQNTVAHNDDLIVDDLVNNPRSLDANALTRIKETALAEPSLLHRLVSPKADVAAVNVTLQLPGTQPDVEVPAVVEFVRKVAAELAAQNPQLEIHLTGMAMFNNAFDENGKNDAMTLTPLMLLIVLVASGILLRSISGTFITFLLMVTTIAATLGLTGWLGIQLTGPTMTVPTMLMTVCVADCVHVISVFLQGMRQGMNKREAIAHSLRLNLHPVFLTSTTTAIGFATMNFSDVPPFRDLGNMVAMGVMIAWALSMTVVPALLLWLPITVRPSDAGKEGMPRFAEWVIRKRNPLFWTMLAFSIVSSVFILRNDLNDQFVEYFDESVDFRRATDFTVDRLTGINLIDYSVTSGEPEGISDPAYLKHLDAFAQWYRAQPETLHVGVITDVFKRLNKNMHGDDSAYYKLPEDRALAAQYLLLYEMSLPQGMDLNNQLNVDKSATRVSVSLKNLSSKEILALEERAAAWMKANWPAAMHAVGASPSVMFAHIGQLNIEDMLVGTVLELLLISCMLIAALKSFKYGLISLIPNLLPAGIAFGLWGLFVGEVGMALSVVASMALGIIVDDTIHFLSKFLYAQRKLGLSPEDSVRYVFNSVGTALWITTAVLVLGFLILAQSHFKVNGDMGLLTAGTLFIGLFLDFLLLPALLIKVSEKKSHEKATAPQLATASV